MHPLQQLLPRDLRHTLLALTEGWHRDPEFTAGAEDVSGLVGRLHRANFELWHHEDRARDPNATDAEIVSVKRAIDRVNQQRNDLVERIDAVLLEALAGHGVAGESAPLHSETPGMMLDRLSILALKTFHTEEELQRRSASKAHLERNRERLGILLAQSGDLAGCLEALWCEALAGTRRFKQYRQLKMYNDPQLNPVLYRGMPPSGA